MVCALKHFDAEYKQELEVLSCGGIYDHQLQMIKQMNRTKRE